jgi:MOSC domain-containing protein YiiM
MTTSPQIRIERIFISPGHNFFGHHGQPPSEHPTLEVREVECVAGRGLRGDRYFDYKPGYAGQITFISAEVFDEVSRQLGVNGKSPGVTRRNVVTRGVDLNSLVGKKFVVQGVEFEGMDECSPCNWMNRAVAPGAEVALADRGGLRAKILTSGKLCVDAEEN